MQAGRSAEISVACGPQSHALAVVAPRSSSLPMGSSTSKPTEPSVAAKVRRAFGRRKKPDYEKEKEKEFDSRSFAGSSGYLHHPVEATPSYATSPPQVKSPLRPEPSRPEPQPSQFSSFSAPKKAPSTDVPRPLPPPPPPPKPATESVPVVQRPQPPPNRTSLIPVSPGMESALTFIAISHHQHEQQQAVAQPSPPSRPPNTSPSSVQPSPPPSDGHSQTEKYMIQGSSRAQEPERPLPQPEVEDPKRIERPRARSESEGVLLDREYADKRKSDSTISHYTIRPGAGGPRPSRPVSMAESFQSSYTIVPGNGSTSVGVVMVNKRLSMVDADLSLLEEDDDSFKSFDDLDDPRDSIVMVRGGDGVANPLLKQKRRSMSLNLGVGGSNPSSNIPVHDPVTGPSATELRQPSHSISEGFYNHPTSTTSSLATSHSNQPHAWTPGRLPPNRNQKLPALPPSLNANFTYPTQRPLPNHPPAPASFRQTAVSISSSFAPAAGLAKRAVEKVRGALGHMGHHAGCASGSISSTSNSSVSGCSSSASVSSVAPSSYPNEWGANLTRTPSNQSSATHATHSSNMHAVNIKEIKDRAKKEKKTRRTPNGRSNESIPTTVIPDSDAFMPSGPLLGVLLRGPMRNRSSGTLATSGVVFGRELTRCVRDTAIWVGKEDDGAKASGRRFMGRPELMVYERRMLPAVVVRCAQHLLLWGMQEEGLFRVPGRNAHITKLRTEFDTGADYDMSGSGPGDLDPHAVASVFKAYLRELPEHILTQKLSPYFDVAIEQEASLVDSNALQMESRQGMGQKPSQLQSSFAFPAPNLRKPPSLSTFAITSFNGMRPASQNLISALRSLLAKLPQENRDLLKTVVELVNATAKESKMTKMPLSNLLMVFLPSLNISAPVLRVLCENERLWIGLVDVSEDEQEAESEPGSAEVEDDQVLDLRRDTVVLDIRRNDDDQQKSKEDGEAATTEGEEADEDEEDEVDAHRRLTVVNRPAIPTVYLDSRSQASSASLDSSGLASSSREASTTESSVLQDDLSLLSASTSSAREDDADEALSSSAESVLTPLTSSAHSSAAYLPLDALDTVKDLSGKGGDNTRLGAGPRIQVVEPEPMDLEIRVEKEGGLGRRFVISNPLPYVSTSAPPPNSKASSCSDKSLPQSPVSPVSPKRRSIPALSFPSLSAFGHRNSPSSAGSEPPSPAESISSRGKGLTSGYGGLRTKKPSLKLLFSKKSAGSLNSVTKEVVAVNGPSSAPGSAPGSACSHSFTSQQLKTASMVLAGGSPGPYSCSSDSSVSTPNSAVTAPGTATSAFGSGVELPPALDAPFEEGPSLRSELGLDESPPVTAKPPKPERKKERVQTMLGTPIADWYSTKSAASSVSDLHSASSQPCTIDEDYDEEHDVEARRRTVLGRARNGSSSQLSMNHLGLDDGELAEEDWTRSVLLAAGAEFGLGRRS